MSKVESDSNIARNPPNPYLEEVNAAEDLITTTFKDKCPRQQARESALMFVGIEIRYYNFEVENPDPIEDNWVHEYNKKELYELEVAFKEVQKGRWSKMKNYFRRQARMAFEAGVYRQSIAEAFVEDNDTLDEINIIAEEDSETRGQAFLNFANSL